MDNLRFSSIAKRYATGISFTVRSKIAYRRSPRVRTPAAYFKAHSRPFATPFSRSPFMTWPSKSATALRESTNSARRMCTVRRFRLCWDCAVNANFMGQLRAKYRFCAVWALSAAVRPAFAVFIYAPGGGNRAKRFQLHRFGAIFKRGGLGACYAERPRRAGRSWRYCMKTLKTIYLFYILNRNYKKFHIFFVDSSKRFQKDIFLRSPLHGCSG